MSAPPAPSPAGKLTLLPLIAATYFIVAGGPFGLEDIVAKAGYGGAILILLLTPALWSFPTALMVSELSSALPEDGGYYVWVNARHGPLLGISGSLAVAGGQCLRYGALSDAVRQLPGSLRSPP